MPRPSCCASPRASSWRSGPGRGSTSLALQLAKGAAGGHPDPARPLGAPAGRRRSSSAPSRRLWLAGLPRRLGRLRRPRERRRAAAPDLPLRAQALLDRARQHPPGGGRRHPVAGQRGGDAGGRRRRRPWTSTTGRPTCATPTWRRRASWSAARRRLGGAPGRRADRRARQLLRAGRPLAPGPAAPDPAAPGLRHRVPDARPLRVTDRGRAGAAVEWCSARAPRPWPPRARWPTCGPRRCSIRRSARRVRARGRSRRRPRSSSPARPASSEPICSTSCCVDPSPRPLPGARRRRRPGLQRMRRTLWSRGSSGAPGSSERIVAHAGDLASRASGLARRTSQDWRTGWTPSTTAAPG